MLALSECQAWCILCMIVLRWQHASLLPVLSVRPC